MSVGLKEVVETGATWVVTGGEDRGVMKLVGETLPNSPKQSEDDDKFPPYIGVCTWGRVLDKEVLQKKKPESCIYVASGESSSESGRQALNHNHTHFLMIDDGTQCYERTHNQWLEEFLKFIEKGGIQLLHVGRLVCVCASSCLMYIFGIIRKKRKIEVYI